jgi:hypothetical protein
MVTQLNGGNSIIANRGFVAQFGSTQAGAEGSVLRLDTSWGEHLAMSGYNTVTNPLSLGLGSHVERRANDYFLLHWSVSDIGGGMGPKSSSD